MHLVCIDSATASPRAAPTATPTVARTFSPTEIPTKRPSLSPSRGPLTSPTLLPSRSPFTAPTSQPTDTTGSPTEHLTDCRFDDIVLVIDSFITFFDAPGNENAYSLQQKFLSEVTDSVYTDGQDTIAYYQYDTSYNILIPYDNAWSKSAIVNIIRNAPLLYDPRAPTNVGFALNKAMDAFKTFTSPSVPKTLFAMVSTSNTTLSNCDSLREDMISNNVDLILVLVTNRTIDYHQTNEATDGPFKCLFDPSRPSLYGSFFFSPVLFFFNPPPPPFFVFTQRRACLNSIPLKDWRILMCLGR